MPRILCLDVGDKRIGVAVTDPLGLTAQGLMTILRERFRKDCAKLLKLLEEYDAQKIIVGLPLDLKDEEGPQARKVKLFVEGFRKFLQERNCPMDIELVDESFSSREAESILLEANLSRKKRRKVIDKLAAVLILENYLDQKPL